MAKRKTSVEVVDTRILKRDPWLRVNKDPGFVYRCAEDDPNRIKELQYIGYEIDRESEPDPDSPIGSIKTTPDSIPPAPAGHVWMRIPKELYDKREAAKDQLVKEQQGEIRDRVEAFKTAVKKTMGRKGFAKLFSDDKNAEEELGF